MRELVFDDAFWRDAFAAIRGKGLADLAENRPGYADLVEELAGEARLDAILVGGRPATPGGNARLWLFVTAALLAREGVRTLFLDLGAELRWLEHLVGEDLKEGLVDHLRYGVPLERCVRPTAFPGLSVLTGGAYFLAGSPLEDAPGLRAALARLTRRHAAVVAVFPHPLEAAEAAGLTARCDVLLTVEEGEVPSNALGTERAVVRLVGDPNAARDLVRLGDRFLGPLTLVLAGSRAASASPPPAAPERAGGPEREEIDFLRAFEDDRPPEAPSDPDAPSVAARRAGGRRDAAAAVTIAALGLAVVVFGVYRFGPLFAGGGVDDGAGIVDGVPSVVVPLDPQSPSAEDGAPAETTAEAEPTAEDGEEAAEPAPPATTPAPWSVHVGSYQSVESARRLVDRIAATGETAFLAPVSLPGKGRWYRVYAGAHGDAAAARVVLERLLSGRVVDDGAVRSTPWAFRLGTHATRAAAEAQLEELRRQGISAYVMGGGPAVVYAGAFGEEEESRLLADMLDGAGAELSRRGGPVTGGRATSQAGATEGPGIGGMDR